MTTTLIKKLRTKLSDGIRDGIAIAGVMLMASAGVVIMLRIFRRDFEHMTAYERDRWIEAKLPGLVTMFNEMWHSKPVNEALCQEAGCTSFGHGYMLEDVWEEGLCLETTKLRPALLPVPPVSHGRAH